MLGKSTLPLVMVVDYISEQNRERASWISVLLQKFHDFYIALKRENLGGHSIPS